MIERRIMERLRKIIREFERKEDKDFIAFQGNLKDISNLIRSLEDLKYNNVKPRNIGDLKFNKLCCSNLWTDEGYHLELNIENIKAQHKQASKVECALDISEIDALNSAILINFKYHGLYKGCINIDNLPTIYDVTAQAMKMSGVDNDAGVNESELEEALSQFSITVETENLEDVNKAIKKALDNIHNVLGW